MVNPDKIQKRLAKLKEYVGFLQDLAKTDQAEFLKNHVIHTAAERDLQLAIECVLDIGNHVIAEFGYREPENYREIITILGEEKILPDDFAEEFAKVAGFRNILVHDYLSVDRAVVYNHMRNKLHDFERFIEYIVKALF
ncbi:MAG: DUF86 domain-containing protein [Clostridia bacterium]|nr:DUF86 domain-containing protein [Clostridia bacterium]